MSDAAASQERTREGLTAHELAMLRQLQDAVSDEAQRKPTLDEMQVWAESMGRREFTAVHMASNVNGYVPTHYVRSLAIARSLDQFLTWCVEHREDIETLFRAKQHNRRRQG